jgi:hypothetical protein
MKRTVALLAALLASVGAASAQQLEFRPVTRSGDIRLSYRWLDHAKREFATSFTLTRKDVNDAEASFRDFSIEAMWQVVENDMRREAEQASRDVRVHFRRQGNNIAWNVEGRDRATIDMVSQRLGQRLRTSQSAYLARHLRRPVGDRMVIVDFAAATSVLQQPMRPVVRALSEANGVGGDDRARVGHALAFFQGIPYDALDVTARQGGDFLPAPALLAQNRGDCDSKSAALAAVLRSYVPSRKIAMVTMPGHAILAINLQPEPGDRMIRADGRTYVALEAAGPHLFPVGQVAPDTERLLSSRNGVEVWPLN